MKKKIVPPEKLIPIEEILTNTLVKSINEQIDRFIAGLNLANKKEIFYKVSLGQIEIFANTLIINDNKWKFMVIKDIICEYYNISFDLIKVHNKRREIVTKRQVLQYFLQNYTRLTLIEIGKKTGGNHVYNHATILHSKEVINDLINSDRLFRNEIREIKLLIEKQLKI